MICAFPRMIRLPGVTQSACASGFCPHVRWRVGSCDLNRIAIPLLTLRPHPSIGEADGWELVQVIGTGRLPRIWSAYLKRPVRGYEREFKNASVNMDEAVAGVAHSGA